MSEIQGKGFYNTTQVDTAILNANVSLKNYVDTNFYNKTISDLRLDNNTIIRTWNTSWITNNVGNWTLDKPNYYNTTQVDYNLTTYYVPYTGSNKNVELGNYNFSVGTSKLFVNSNTGYVGIGTTSPTNTLSVNGTINVTGTSYLRNAEFNEGWTNGGVSIINGNIYAQSAYFYNISGLDVSTLKINGSLLPATGFDNTFDLGNSTLRWRNLYLGNNAYVNGSIYGNSVYQNGNQVLDTRYNSLSNFTNDLGIGNWTLDKPNYYNKTQIESNFTNYYTIPQINTMNTTMTNFIISTNTSMKNYVDNNFYLKSNPYAFYNSTTLQNISQLANNLGYYNSTTLQNISQLNNNLGYYNTTTLTMAVIQGKGFYNTTQVDNLIVNANASLKNYVDNNFYNKTISDLRLDNASIIRTWNTSWITNNVGNWSQDKPNYYNKTQIESNFTNYYNITQINAMNTTMTNFVISTNTSMKNYVDTLNLSQADWVTTNFYSITNPYAFYNSTTLQNISQLNNNLGYYNTTTLTMSVIQGKGFYNTTQVDTNIANANTSMANYVVYVNGTMKSYVDSQDILFNNSIANYINNNFYNQTSIDNSSIIRTWNTSWITTNVGNWSLDKINYYNKTEVTANITSANTSMKNYVDNTFYLKTNPYAFYNSTTLQNISQLNNNLGYYNTTTLTMAVIQGKGFYNTTQVDTNIANANTSMANYVIANYYNRTYIDNNLALNSSLQNYVPYTGANKNINLGNNNLTINGSTLFVNTNTGKVGIGTTSPSQKLEVNGNANITQNLTIGGATVFTDITGNMIFRI